MSRTGPEYVESESELYQDLDLKRKQGQISEEVSQAFIDLYDFAQDLGDDIEIGEAKNANFRMFVDAHRGDYQNNPSVFSANVSGLVKIWPAKMPYNHESEPPVGWDEQDYVDFKHAFQSLRGVPRGDQEVSFQTLVTERNLEEFKSIVEDYVTICREKA
ncbi:hypothetical protein [Haloferax sp. ATB1]|uniref:hypothetical protein n=1 Tax=Haloferax sp. ATB1 TaxID=1508454 RepID=UPI000AAFBAC3|nr:hypothetical protein [Haloferax sp. ATB1]